MKQSVPMDKAMKPQTIPDALKGISKSCIELFKSHRNGQSDLAKTIDGHARSFDIWTAYTGALAADALSLDSRLAELPDIKDAIYDLLQLVYSSLQSVNAEVDNVQILDPIEAIEEALSVLHKLGVAVRKASIPNSRFNLTSHNVRIDKRYEPYFEDLAKTLVRTTYPHARQSLQDQVGSSISLRRKRLLYQIHHNERLGAQDKTPSRNDQNVGMPTEPHSPAIPSRSNDQERWLPEAHISPSISSSKASKPDKMVYRNILQRPTQSVFSERHGIIVRDQGIRYPAVPEFAAADKWWQCRYCNEPILTSRLAGPDGELYWRRHIDKDLQPYVCLSERCTTPPQFFVHSTEWITHMRTVHHDNWTQSIHSIAWQCDIAHEPMEFDKKDNFVAHLKSSEIHIPPPNDSQCSALIRRKQIHSLRRAAFCPLCEVSVKPTPSIMRNSKLSDVENHIADHLKYLAFFSLPDLDDEVKSQDQALSIPYADSGIDSNQEVGSYISANTDVSSLAYATSHAGHSQGGDQDTDGVMVYDRIPTYRMHRGVMESYLARRFPNHWNSQSLTIDNDCYVLQLPRLLTKEERADLQALRDSHTPSVSHDNKPLEHELLKQAEASASYTPPPPALKILKREDIYIAIICALKIENDAVEAVFDNHHDYSLGKSIGDSNNYSINRIGEHNIVLVHGSGLGTFASAQVMAGLRSSFRNIKLALSVGLCGGVPNPPQNAPIFLGDVIISTSIVHYSSGLQLFDNSRSTLDIKAPQQQLKDVDRLLNTIRTYQAHAKFADAIDVEIKKLYLKPEFRSVGMPGQDTDVLFPPEYRHKHQDPTICIACGSWTPEDDVVCSESPRSSCQELGCDKSKALSRNNRRDSSVIPRSTSLRTDVHYGKIASSDFVLRSALHRDEIAERDRILGFDMDAAGVAMFSPTLIIDGVCDYADDHRDKRWQQYACLAAAACARVFLLGLPAFEEPSAPIRVTATETKQSSLTDVTGQDPYHRAPSSDEETTSQRRERRRYRVHSRRREVHVVLRSPSPHPRIDPVRHAQTSDEGTNTSDDIEAIRQARAEVQQRPGSRNERRIIVERKSSS